MEDIQAFFTNILQIFAYFFGFIKELFGGEYPWADETTESNDEG